jgi:hypothetical protein
MLREDKESFSLNQLWVISGPTKYTPQSRNAPDPNNVPPPNRFLVDIGSE